MVEPTHESIRLQALARDKKELHLEVASLQHRIRRLDIRQPGSQDERRRLTGEIKALRTAMRDVERSIDGLTREIALARIILDGPASR